MKNFPDTKWIKKALPGKAELTMFNNFNQAPEMRQDSTTHKNSNLLYNLDASVPGLPGLFAFTDSFQKG